MLCTMDPGKCMWEKRLSLGELWFVLACLCLNPTGGEIWQLANIRRAMSISRNRCPPQSTFAYDWKRVSPSITKIVTAYCYTELYSFCHQLSLVDLFWQCRSPLIHFDPHGWAVHIRILHLHFYWRHDARTRSAKYVVILTALSMGESCLLHGSQASRNLVSLPPIFRVVAQGRGRHGRSCEILTASPSVWFSTPNYGFLGSFRSRMREMNVSFHSTFLRRMDL